MNQESTDHFVLPEQLCIGLYIFIDLPWFSHPFSFNQFKIKSADQIATLRGLGVKRFRYDPARSDLAVHSPGAATAGESAAEPAPAEPAPLDPLTAAAQARARHLRARQERIGHVEKAFAKAAAIMRNINRNLISRPTECISEVSELVHQMTSAFLDAPEVTLHVMGEKAGGEEAYFHGLNCSVLSMMLAKGLGMAHEDCRLLGLGALFHDIGLMDIPDKVLKKTSDFTHAEIELRKMHCEYGLRIAKKVGLPEAAQLVIYQHHELVDGSGYPRGLKGNAIHQLARIVGLVNHYDNLCNPVDVSKALTPHEALSLMFAKMRDKFDGQALQLMIRSLGVYPPGSIVKLSNEALAVVQSVNPEKPLRPWVVVYDETIPKDEALMIDLEQEPELHIAKAIRPNLLPAAVYEYLSPRKRVTYYFDSDVRGGQS